MKKESFWSPPLFGHQYWLTFSRVDGGSWLFKDEAMEIVVYETTSQLSEGNTLVIFIGKFGGFFRVWTKGIENAFYELESQLKEEHSNQSKKISRLKNRLIDFRKSLGLKP